MLPHIIIYLLSFAGIWIGSGLAISAVERLSKILRVSSFALSFIILGLFTSVSEFSVGVNSIIEQDPEIYVGNLIGASIVLFMLIIPLLAITGKKINISKEFQGFNLPASLVVVSLPVVLSMDGKITRIDSVIAVLLFAFLVLAIQSKKGLFHNMKKINSQSKVKVGKELLRIIFGVVLIFIASKFVVEQTLYFSQVLHISPFVISLLFIAIGTNVPELSFVIRSAFMKDNQVAFGDYVGSASVNTLLFGILALIFGKTIFLTNSYMISLYFLIFGLLAFYYFARTKNSISRIEGLFLLCMYLTFIATELFLQSGRLIE